MKIEIQIDKPVDLIKIAEQLEKIFNLKLIQRQAGDKIHGYLGQKWLLGKGSLIFTAITWLNIH